MSLVNPEYGLSPKTREVLDWLDARRRDATIAYNQMCRVELQSDRIPARGVIGAQPTGDAPPGASRLSR